MWDYLILVTLFLVVAAGVARGVFHPGL